MAVRGWLFYLSGRASDAIPIIVGGITAYRSTGATQSLPVLLSSLASAYAEMGKFEDAQRCIDEAIVAIETTKEKWFEADINRLAGEIALKSPELSATTAEAYFERALAARYGASIAQVSLRSSAASEVLGTPRRSEHGAALAQPGQAGSGTRASHSHLRLVRRGVRYARSEGGEGAAG